jgi:ribonucleoside-diphosphate reductase alpha chain
MTTISVALCDNARRVLEARYLRRDEQRCVVESPQQMFERVAHAVAEAEGHFAGHGDVGFWEERFLRTLCSLDFLPNSPTLMNAGTPVGQLSACFVLPVGDSLEDIFDALKLAALIQRTGGGTGFSFSRLRPRGSLLSSTGGEASGPVSFMKIFDSVTEHVKLGGRRRGANMGVLRVDHPDILEFVSAKQDASDALRNFNLSVGVTDAFMLAVRDGRDYDLIDPHRAARAGRLAARDVFDTIVNAAWRTGDPGLLFLDTINRSNPTPHLGDMEATNPCGEVPLLPYEACNLGSINLAHMLRDDNGSPVADWERLRDVVELAVRFLDDVIEVGRYPSELITQVVQGNRKIGLGVMGFAEMLIRLAIPYDSDAAVKLASRLMRYVFRAARLASSRLVEERGIFPFWAGSVWEDLGLRVRNATLTSVAPTGTLSIIAGTTAGIEPLFALAYRRHALEGEVLSELSPLLRDHLSEAGVDVPAVLASVIERGSLPSSLGLAAETRRLFATALEIPARRHLQIQSAFQRYTDNSVSKTINLSGDATVEDVSRIYRDAWSLGLKGITVYRYGSKPSQVLELGAGEEAFQYEHAARCDPTECGA